MVTDVLGWLERLMAAGRPKGERSTLRRPLGTQFYQTDGGTKIASFGTSVARETCGQVSGPKFKKTFCEYWIWVKWKVGPPRDARGALGYCLFIGSKPLFELDADTGGGNVSDH